MFVLDVGFLFILKGVDSMAGGPRVSSHRAWSQNVYLLVTGEAPRADLEEPDLQALRGIITDAFDDSFELQVFCMHVGVNCEVHNYRQISEHFGVTYEKVRKTVLKCARRLKHPSISKKMKILFMERGELCAYIRDLGESREAVEEVLYDRKVDFLNFSEETVAILARNSINTIAELMMYCREELQCARGMTSLALREIEEELRDFGLALPVE